MKRIFKAFTLIELIVVIAIFGILMAGLMNFFRPIRGTYVDSTLYEQQRTTQNGIIEFLCENTRYAEKLRVYDEGCTAEGVSVNSGGKAFEAFCKEMSIDSTTYDTTEDLKDAKYKVHIICINRKQPFSNTGVPNDSDSKDRQYYGRIITNIVSGDLDSTKQHLKYAQYSNDWGTNFEDKGQRATHPDSMTTYMALGGAYYGAADYVIYVDKDSDKNGLTFGVISQQVDNGNVVKGSHALANSTLTNDDGFITVETVQGNLTKNLEDYKYYLAGSEPFGTITPTGSINGAGASGKGRNTWIVYTVPDEGTR